MPLDKITNWSRRTATKCYFHHGFRRSIPENNGLADILNFKIGLLARDITPYRNLHSHYMFEIVLKTLQLRSVTHLNASPTSFRSFSDVVLMFHIPILKSDLYSYYWSYHMPFLIYFEAEDCLHFREKETKEECGNEMG